MTIMMIILKYICFVIGLIYGFGNIVRAQRRLTIHGPQIWLMALGIAGYLLLEIDLGF